MNTPLSHLPLGNMRCFHVFNGASLCAPRSAPHTPGSSAFRLNLDITVDLVIAFTNICRQRESEFKHPSVISTGGLFGEGLTEFSCHNDDVGVVTHILDDMRKQNHLSQFTEVPMHASQTFGMAKVGV